MRHTNYTLSPTRINNAKPQAKPYKLTDGGGLYLLIIPSGAKSWRYQYKLGGTRGEVSIGKFPEIGVADARDRHFECRAMVERGEDPAELRRKELEERKDRNLKAKQGGDDDFEAFSRRWITERLKTKSKTYRAQIESRLERFVWPEIGAKALNTVKPLHVLAIIEARRATPNTAEGVRIIIQQVYNYAIQKLLVEVNPALPLRGVIEVPAAAHHKHLKEAELGAFWRSVEKQGAHFVTIAATKMLMYSMCRKSEVLRATWDEIDLDKAVWDIPAGRMKMKQPHRVYLSSQALEIFRFLKAIGEARGYVFPSVLRGAVPLGDVTLNHFFKRLDFGVEEFSPHGTRGTAATLLREHGFGREVVELLLAHAERNHTAAAYHHHELPEERRRALQYLADQIDRLAATSAVDQRKAAETIRQTSLSYAGTES
ncbi:tyrosine-type recombinase/integrase [Rhodoferax sp. UBA5149]|uniref:tyrosine-type recombinase/integrase n=1 Tax=Rhodoferax sp. UBA5149 TaxID=1947379 RepID=UPI0025DF07A3|nr:integrase arm-type DNA-binding domain-containing protein [Rhodoferax sp. UBA5149]